MTPVRPTLNFVPFVTQEASKGGGTYTPTPVGTYSARLVHVFDLGFHDAVKVNEKKLEELKKAGKSDKDAEKEASYTVKERLMAFDFELNFKSDGSNFNRVETFRCNFNTRSDKSTFYKNICRWIGDESTKAGYVWDFEALLERPATVTVELWKSGKGTGVKTVAAPMAGIVPHEITSRNCFFWSVQLDPGLTDEKLPKKLKESTQWFPGADTSDEHKAWKRAQEQAEADRQARAVFGGGDDDEPFVAPPVGDGDDIPY